MLQEMTTTNSLSNIKSSPYALTNVDIIVLVADNGPDIHRVYV